MQCAEDKATSTWAQEMCAEVWSRWTSETNVGQQLLDWHETCSNGSLTAMEPSDDYFGLTFQKVVLTDRLQPQMDHLQRARLTHAIRSAWSRWATQLSRPTQAKQSAQLTHEKWLTQLTHGALETRRSAHGPQQMYTERWPQWTSETDVDQWPSEYGHQWPHIIH